VWGHSAGAMLAAQVALRRGGVADELIKGLVLISGFYDLRSQPAEIVNRQSDRFVPNLCAAIERVPPHTIVIVGEHDFPAALQSAEDMVAALRARGASVEYFIEANADHFQANRGFISPDGGPFAAALRMTALA
jgi:acetyl esterase/lipase